MPGTNAEHLAARTRRRGHERRTATVPPTSQLAADPLIAEYLQGPFPALNPPSPPVHARRLLEYLLGRPVPEEVLLQWERVRAFVAYQGLELPPAASLTTWPADPRPAPPTAPTPAPTPAPPAPRARKITSPGRREGPADPHDLGD